MTVENDQRQKILEVIQEFKNDMKDSFRSLNERIDGFSTKREKLWDYLTDGEKSDFNLVQQKIKSAQTEAELDLAEYAARHYVRLAYDRYKHKDDMATVNEYIENKKQKINKIVEDSLHRMEEITNGRPEQDPENLNSIKKDVMEFLNDPKNGLHNLQDEHFKTLKDQYINSEEMVRYLQQLMFQSSSEHEQILNEITNYVFKQSK